MNIFDHTTHAQLSTHDALRRCVVIDVETTGLDPDTERIIEIGAALIVNGSIAETFHELINPLRPLSPVIRDLTGLTDSTLSQARTSADVLPSFLSFLSRSFNSDATSLYTPCAFVGHNVDFDLKFLGAELGRLDNEQVPGEGDTRALKAADDRTWRPLPPVASLCTAELARDIIPREAVGRYRLANIADYFDTPHKPSHRALDDVFATFEILTELNRNT